MNVKFLTIAILERADAAVKKTNPMVATSNFPPHWVRMNYREIQSLSTQPSEILEERMRRIT